MDKPWLANYPEGMPAEIDPDAFPSATAVVEQTCQRFADRPAFSNLGRTLSFAELDALSRDFAAYLQQELGLNKGDRVAIMLPNLLQFPVVLFGVLRAGLTAVNVNPLYTARELQHQLADSGASAIIILANFAATLEQVLAKTQVRTVVVTEIGDLLPFGRRLLVNFVVRHVRKMVPAHGLRQAVALRSALSRGESLRLTDPQLCGDDLAFLQYTGGTTGVAKGAMLTHRNMVANMEQVSALLGLCIEDGEEIMITPLPLYHVLSLTANCLCFMKHGAHNVLITNPRDIPAFVKELRRWRFSAMTGVNTLFNALLHHPDFASLDFSGLKIVVGGGMAVQRAVADRWQEVTGSPLLEGYGLTETSPVVACNLPSAHRGGTIGLPAPSTEVSIRDEQGVEVAQGERGELCVRGPQVMKGYWQRPEETRQAIDDQGWFHTGDIAIMDADGYLRIVDRKKDMIVVSGFNVYPNEVEDVLVHHPAVLECACIGVPNEHSGEAVKAFVVLKPGVGEVSAAELIEHCRKDLTRYKVPHIVEFRDELPKSNVGKILRRALRDQT